MTRLAPLLLALSLAAACSDDVSSDPVPDAATSTDSGRDAASADAGADASETPDASDDAALPTTGWYDAAPLGAGPRQETAAVELGGEIYVLGGYNASIQIVATVEVWDPATDVWSRAADLPVRMHHANAVSYDGKIYVLGFLGPGFVADGRSFVYDPSTDAWSPIAEMPAGSERGSSAVGVIGESIYVVGGLRGGAVADASRYDPATDSWTPLADAPRALDHAGFGVIDSELVIAGGRSGAIAAHVPDVDIYDPQADSWRSGAPMPTSRAGVAAAVYDGALFVLGGEGNGAEASGVFAEVEAYDPGSDEWTELPPMKVPRHGMAAASFDGGILVPGGAQQQAFGAVDVVDIYVP